MRHPGGHYLVVRDMEETDLVCAYIRRGPAGGLSRDAFLERFAEACSPGFDPDRHLERVGVANQTTMLSSESLAIAARLQEAIGDRHGMEGLQGRFRSFDTICSATQDRQDAVMKLTSSHIDVLLIIGGYNSSNTNHLASIGGLTVSTYHIDSAGCILGPDAIRHKPYGSREEAVTKGWLPDGPVVVGVTAGASTPNVMIGQVIEAVARCRGADLEAVAS